MVAHCLLNQNARIDRCAYFPGAMGEAAQALLDSGVGVLQMPCLGSAREFMSREIGESGAR